MRLQQRQQHQQRRNGKRWRDRRQPEERESHPDDRLEELPRTGNPRRGLRPGVAGCRLQGEDRPQPGSETVALQTLNAGQISGYPEYASTALTSFFGLEPEEVPSGAQPAYEKAKAEFEKEGLTAFPPTPFASANAVGTLKKTADELGLKTISDLEGQSEELTLYGSPECRQRIDCLAGLEKYYGLKFKSFTPIDIGLRYTVLEKGQADLSILFTTDPQLSAEKDKFVILEDDKEVFPAGNIIFVSKASTAEKAGPDYEKTIIQVQKGLTLPVMQELDARVELEKQSPAQAAAAYLKEAGYTG